MEINISSENQVKELVNLRSTILNILKQKLNPTSLRLGTNWTFNSSKGIFQIMLMIEPNESIITESTESDIQEALKGLNLSVTKFPKTNAKTLFILTM